MSQSEVRDGDKSTRSSGNSAANLQDQILTYTNKVQNILEKVQANIKESKFLVERTENGIKFDIALKATIKDVPTRTSMKTSTSDISE